MWSLRSWKGLENSIFKAQEVVYKRSISNMSVKLIFILLLYTTSCALVIKFLIQLFKIINLGKNINKEFLSGGKVWII